MDALADDAPDYFPAGHLAGKGDQIGACVAQADDPANHLGHPLACHLAVDADVLDQRLLRVLHRARQRADIRPAGDIHSGKIQILDDRLGAHHAEEPDVRRAGDVRPGSD